MDETCFWTLIALCILEEIFAEWKLISNKAKAYLKSNQIDVQDEIDDLIIWYLIHLMFLLIIGEYPFNSTELRVWLYAVLN